MAVSKSALSGLLIGPFLLAGCSGEIMQSRIDRPGTDRYFQYGAAPGEMRAVVVGNPFPVAKQIVDLAVVDAMQRNHHGPATRFTTEPGPKAHTEFRIVMAFNTPTVFPPSGLCGDPAGIPSGKTTDGRLKLFAGFCVGEKLYSRATVSAPAMDAPTDSRFASMVRTAMWQLVPYSDPFDTDEERSSIILP